MEEVSGTKSDVRLKCWVSSGRFQTLVTGDGIKSKVESLADKAK